MNFTAEPTEIKILLLQAGKILSIIGRKIAGEKIGEEKSTIDWSLALSQYVTSGIEYIAIGFDVRIDARNFSLVSQARTLFRFYLWWRKRLSTQD